MTSGVTRVLRAVATAQSARAALVMVPLLSAAPRFLGGGAVKMYAFELLLVSALLAAAWRK